ncbi:hypothetical protein Tco_1104001 [Tanacetum coccineum]
MLTYEAKTGAYSFELDETRFVLDANPSDKLRDYAIDPKLSICDTSVSESYKDFVMNIVEEFLQAIQTFLTDKANLGSPTKKGRKDKPHVIPYCQFTKLIICHLGRIHNIHQRSASPFHLAEEDLRLAEKEGKKKTASGKQPNLKLAKEKPSKPSTAKPPKPKPAKEKSTKATPLQKVGKGKVAKVHNVNISFQLVDELDEEPTQHEPEPEPEHQGEGEEYDRSPGYLPVVEWGPKKGKLITPATEEASTRPSAQPQDNTSANIVRDSPSSADAETGVRSDTTNSGGDTEILQIAGELGEDVDKQVNQKEKTAELDQDQAGSDPGKTYESRPLPAQVFMDEDQAGLDPGISRVALAGPDTKPTHDKFMANLYPKFKESLKFPADEHVILDDPLSLTETLSSMKNLEDAYPIGDQFINDESTDDEPGLLTKLGRDKI